MPDDVLAVLNARSQDIFRKLVERYLETGVPVGSRDLSRLLSQGLSPATVRNVMADLEDLGLIAAPHTSAGRLPTQQGLRFFVDAMLEVGAVDAGERHAIEQQIEGRAADGKVEDLLTQASQLLSGLSHGAGVVIAQKSDLVLRHIEFIRLDAERAMVVLVGEDGSVENRVLKLPPGMTANALVEASNYLAHLAVGHTLSETRKAVWTEIDFDKATWTIPGERMKAKETHVVPLSQSAVSIVRRRWKLRTSDDGLVFSNNGEKPISDMTMTKLLRDAGIKGATVHGFRSAFTDWAAEKTDFPKEVADKALAHKLSNQVEAAYRRTDFFDKRRELMTIWATYLDSSAAI